MKAQCLIKCSAWFSALSVVFAAQSNSCRLLPCFSATHACTFCAWPLPVGARCVAFITPSRVNMPVECQGSRNVRLLRPILVRTFAPLCGPLSHPARAFWAGSSVLPDICAPLRARAPLPQAGMTSSVWRRFLALASARLVFFVHATQTCLVGGGAVSLLHLHLQPR